MNRVAIIAAMAGELKPLVGGWERKRRNGVDLFQLRRGDSEWVATCAGAGQQAATRAFAEAEKDGPLSSVFSIGWVGALSPNYVAGRAYWVSGVIDSRTGERFVAEDAGESDDAFPRIQSRDLGHQELWLVTSPKVANAGEKQRLATAYGAGLVDMEAAAIARLAGMRGIPFRCIKGVSDGFAENLPDFNRFISPEGQFQTGRLLLYVLSRPWHWPALIRIGENGNKASRAIRDLLLENLDGPGAIENRNGNSNFKR
jgi:adenosylhomocysteine nucleosidase